MTFRLVVYGIGIVLALILLWAAMAKAHHIGDPVRDTAGRLIQYADPPTAQWFQDLRLKLPEHQGGDEFGCCGAYDCTPTKAVYMDGQWWTAMRAGKPGELFPVPEERVLKDKVSPFAEGGEGLAVLCEAQYQHAYAAKLTGSMGSTGFLFCFVVPPTFS